MLPATPGGASTFPGTIQRRNAAFRLNTHDVQLADHMKSIDAWTLPDGHGATRNANGLLGCYYLYDCGKGRLLPRSFPKAHPQMLEMFSDLVDVAAKYKKLTGRHLPILGELGEVFAEIAFGIRRHDPMTQGSDGMLGNDFVEVKTITPDKTNDTVHVKRAGNFGKLVVVKISDDFQFGARMVDRGMLTNGNGKMAKLSWGAMVANEKDQECHRNFPIKKASPKNKPV